MNCITLSFDMLYDVVFNLDYIELNIQVLQSSSLLRHAYVLK